MTHRFVVNNGATEVLVRDSPRKFAKVFNEFAGGPRVIYIEDDGEAADFAEALLARPVAGQIEYTGEVVRADPDAEGDSDGGPETEAPGAGTGNVRRRASVGRA